MAVRDAWMYGAEGTAPADAYTRNRYARYVATACGAIAFFLFYQPWVSATLPAVGDERLTGLELARGDAVARVDRAAFAGPARGGAAGAPAGAASAGGLSLPTRIPTVAAGAAAGLALPTRIPTVAPGASSGGITLPTRIPTVVPGATTQPAASGAGGQLAGGGAAGTVLEVGRAAARPAEPDRLPRTSLYLLPAAAAALAVFAVVWDRFPEARDRRFGVLWTILVSFGGSVGTGWVLWKVTTAAAGNDLLGPGTVNGAEWPLWGLFLAFLASAAAITVAWLSPRPPPPSPYGARAVL